MKPHLYLKEWRKFRGLTQMQMSERTGMDPASISRAEHGKSSVNRFEFARALECEPHELLHPPNQVPFPSVRTCRLPSSDRR